MNILKINPIRTIVLATALTAGTMTASTFQKNVSQDSIKEKQTVDKFEKEAANEALLSKDAKSDLLFILAVFGGMAAIGLTFRSILHYLDRETEMGIGPHFDDGNHMGGD